jgi:hypothetical protein
MVYYRGCDCWYSNYGLMDWFAERRQLKRLRKQAKKQQRKIEIENLMRPTSEELDVAASVVPPYASGGFLIIIKDWKGLNGVWLANHKSMTLFVNNFKGDITKTIKLDDDILAQIKNRRRKH